MKNENEGEKLLKKRRDRGRQINRPRDRWKERERGARSFSFTPYRMNGASVLLPCSNTPHGCLLPATTMHTHTHTYPAACLTGVTITPLRVIDGGEENEMEKKIDNTHTQSPKPPPPHILIVVWLSCQLDRLGCIYSVLLLIHPSSVQSGQTRLCKRIKKNAYTHLFGQGWTSGIVSRGKKGGDNRSPSSLSDYSHTHSSVHTHAPFRHPFSSAVVHDLDHTQTNRLALQGKKVPTPHTRLTIWLA